MYQCFARNKEGEVSTAAVFRYTNDNNEAVDLNFAIQPNHVTGEMDLTWTETDEGHMSYVQIVDYNCVDEDGCQEGTKTINSASLSNTVCDHMGRCHATCCEASQPQPAVEYEFRLSLLYPQPSQPLKTSDRVRATTFDGR